MGKSRVRLWRPLLDLFWTFFWAMTLLSGVEIRGHNSGVSLVWLIGIQGPSNW